MLKQETCLFKKVPWHKDAIGFLASPFGGTFGCKESSPCKSYDYVVNKLNEYRTIWANCTRSSGMHSDSSDVHRVAPLPQRFKGVLMTASAFDHADGMKTIDDGVPDIIVFGHDLGPEDEEV